MYKLTSKILTPVLVTMLLIGSLTPFAITKASATFNNDSLDKPTLRVSNYTKNPGSSTSWATSVSADAGDIISFDIYYHNTSSETAIQTKTRAGLPLGNFTTANIAGYVWANNASAASDNVYISLSSSQTLTFIPGSVSWYPNQLTTSRSLLNGQNGSQVVTLSGLNIGDIAAGWGAQGHVVFRAQVSNVSLPLISGTSASNISSSGATLNANINPNGASTTAWFEYGTSSSSLTYATSTQSLGSGTSSNSVSSNISNLSSNTTYYFRAVAQNSQGTTYGSTLSFTTSASQTTSAPSVTTNSATSISTNAATLNANINPNGASTTAWFEYGTSSSSLTYATSTQSLGSGTSSNSVSSNISNLSSNTTYYFRAVAQNSQGTTYGSTLSFTTSASQTTSAPSTTTNSATSISTNAATLNANINPNGASTTAWFEYGTSSSSLTYATSTQSLGSGTSSNSISSNISSLSSNTTYYFRAVAQNSQGTIYGSTLSFTTSASQTTSAPSVTTNSATSISTNAATLNANINPNGASTTAWFEYGTSSSSLTYATSTQSLGSGTSSNSVSSNISNLSSNTTYYFRAVAQNSQGTTYGSTLSFTTSANPTSASAPSVATYSATSISSNSASFSGLVNPNNVSTNGWFEYGTSSSSLSYTTSVQSLGSGSSSVSLGATVSGLSENTTYYYRAVAQNSYGTTYGSTLSLTTAIASASSTAPSVTANAATAITSNSARLNSTINPNGSETTVSFEYGANQSSLNKTSSSYKINGNSYVPVTIGISELSANTTYYFRPVAKNSAGTTYGATNSFVTSSATATTTTKTTSTSTTTTTSTATTTTNNNYSNKPYIDIANGLTVENLTSPNGNGTVNFANIGDRLKYTITIRNTGGATGYGIKISDQFSSVLRYIESSSKSGFDSVANIVSWDIAKLVSGESATMYFTVEVKGGLNTTIDNQAKEYLLFADLNVYSNTVSTLIIKQEPISVKLSVDKTEVKSGEILDYSLTINNPNDYSLNNFLLSIGLPENVELQDADFTIFNKSDKSLVIDLGSFAANQEVVKKFSAKVTEQAKEGDILTLIAIANYQDAAGNIQPVISASISTTVIGSFNLMASIFGGIGSLSWKEWLALFTTLILILTVSYASRKIYKRYKTVKVKIQQG